jgi:hypothetical protein
MVGVGELPRHVDTVGDAAKRAETLGRTAALRWVAGGTAKKLRRGDETRENKPGSQESGDGRIEEAAPEVETDFGAVLRVTR